MSLLKSLIERVIPPAGKIVSVTDVSILRTQSLPLEYWIELTSKCPFDCVFCSRSTLRGKGEHMEFALYQKIIAQMHRPAVIRLNYSGESIHYPRLGEAIALAKSTGARVELVTVLSSAKPKVIEALVRERLDRLTISIHALNEPAYQSIYGHSSVVSLRENIGLLQSFKNTYGSHLPLVDFAFVAMERNLSELPLVAALAKDIGVGQIDIHPVIRRDEIEERFSQELIAGSLTGNFRAQLAQMLTNVSNQYPAIALNVSSRELDINSCLGEMPVAFSGLLPDGAKIFSCEQNPWSTVHVLANGDLVTCEVRDKTVLGNLQTDDLHAIWHSHDYQQFRDDYSEGVDEKCRNCIYKLAYQPLANTLQVKPYLYPMECQQQLLSGWHAAEGNHVWSATYIAKAVVFKSVKASRLQVSGILPSVPDITTNVLCIKVGSTAISVENTSNGLYSFRVNVPLESIGEALTVIEFEVASLFAPQEKNIGMDARQLGFALTEIICR